MNLLLLFILLGYSVIYVTSMHWRNFNVNRSYFPGAFCSNLPAGWRLDGMTLLELVLFPPR